MQSAETQITLASAGVAAAFNFIVGHMFDIPPTTVAVVFVAAFFGLIYRPGIVMPANVSGKLKLLAKTFGWLVVITMIASWGVPLLASILPGVAQNSIAALLGFVCMLKREELGSFIVTKFRKKVE